MAKHRGITGAIIKEIEKHDLPWRLENNRRGHPRIYIKFPSGKSRFVVFSRSCSDTRRGKQKAVAHLRRLITENLP